MSLTLIISLSKAMSSWNVELQTSIYVISTSRKNLNFIECIKISPTGRNDRLLIKPSILSVIELIENATSLGAEYVSKKAKFNQ